MKSLAIIGVAVLTPAFALSAQTARPSIAFGESQISLGMTQEQVEKNLEASGRHIDFLSDKQTAIIRRNDVPIPNGDEGQATFAANRVVYAAFRFPVARDTDELAQEIAGAIEDMDTKACSVSNYSSHGTGGGFSQSSFDCGSKSVNIVTVQTLGSSERYTNVEITIGAIPTRKKP